MDGSNPCPTLGWTPLTDTTETIRLSIRWSLHIAIYRRTREVKFAVGLRVGVHMELIDLHLDDPRKLLHDFFDNTLNSYWYYYSYYYDHHHHDIMFAQRKQWSSVVRERFPSTNFSTPDSTAQQPPTQTNFTCWRSRGPSTAGQSATTLGITWPKRWRHREAAGSCGYTGSVALTTDDISALRPVDWIPPALSRLTYSLKVNKPHECGLTVSFV